MASSSDSSNDKSYKYDVFFSFRGENTRNTFVIHLYKDLEQDGIKSYKDDEKLKKGETIDNQLIKSIEDSRFLVIAFSKNYASSSWCLDELIKIMECQKTADQTAYLVFYDVEPTEVHKQNLEQDGIKSYKDDEKIKKGETIDNQLIKSIKDSRFLVITFSTNYASSSWCLDELIKIMECQKTVDQTAYLVFYDVEPTEALKEAADLAGWELKKTGNGVDEKLVGMEMQINDVLSSLKIGVQDVRMIGIKGIGGGGKTTLARAVYDQISNQFEGKGFVENLEALCGASNWFNLGSIIIITTRDEQVLVAYRVNFIHSFVHKINLLSVDEAICLFSSCLFLCGQDEIEWKDALERLKTILLEATVEKLEISCLEADYKEIFLDISCLLEGWYEDEAIRALESCSFYARNGLRILEQKSLIQISKYRDLRVKGLANLKELRFLIVYSLNNELSGSEDDCYGSDQESNEVSQYLPNSLRFLRWSDYPFWNFPKTFTANNLGGLELHDSNIVFHKLRFLDIFNLKVRTLDLRLIPNLEILHIIACEDLVELWMPTESLKLRSINLTLTPNLDKLCLINCHDLVELLMPTESQNLRILKLNHSKLKTLRLRIIPNLVKLILKDCNDLVELHMPTKSLKLRSLKLSHSKLKILKLEITPNLAELILQDCNDLVELNMLAKIRNLRSLKLSNSKLRIHDLGITLNLVELILKDWKFNQDREKNEKLKELKARLNFVGCPGTSRRERSRSPIRREWSRSPRQRAKERGMFKRLESRGKSVSARSDSYNQHSDSRYTKALSESEDNKGGHCKSRSKKKKSSEEENDLSQPWVCEETGPFTPQIYYFGFPKTRMPSHIKTYNESIDLKDHLKI
nr:hypothetical protein [Tanacetum cinerariifolium]